jgi:hypothetical protein
MLILGGAAYKETTIIALKATMPGLNRRLDHFDYQKAIEIQYPLELQNIDYLDSVAQGSENKITMQIHNKSNKPFGGGRVSPRRTEVKISIPSETGSLLASAGTWGTEVVQRPGLVKARSSVYLIQPSMISHQAKDHAYAEIRIEFYISNPGPAHSNQRSIGASQRMTQSFDLMIQVSATHVTMRRLVF